MVLGDCLIGFLGILHDRSSTSGGLDSRYKAANSGILSGLNYWSLQVSGQFWVQSFELKVSPFNAIDPRKLGPKLCTSQFCSKMLGSQTKGVGV